MFAKATNILAKDGFNAFLAIVYRRWVRVWLWPETVRYAGIPVSFDRKWGDRFLPAAWTFAAPDLPDYENALVSGLKQWIEPGDTVTVVGGGLGVTTAIAALQSGPKGVVHCFEGSKTNLAHVERTIAKNAVANVTLHFATVEDASGVYGAKSEHADVIMVSALPYCDVLELDCEGAEVKIIQNLSFRPRVILVETHGFLNAPTEVVYSLLLAKGYTVISLGLADSMFADFCRQNDICVLVGVDDERRR